MAVLLGVLLQPAAGACWATLGRGFVRMGVMISADPFTSFQDHAARFERAALAPYPISGWQPSPAFRNPAGLGRASFSDLLASRRGVFLGVAVLNAYPIEEHQVTECAACGFDRSELCRNVMEIAFEYQYAHIAVDLAAFQIN